MTDDEKIERAREMKRADMEARLRDAAPDMLEALYQILELPEDSRIA